jgi:hypothetical protein
VNLDVHPDGAFLVVEVFKPVQPTSVVLAVEGIRGDDNRSVQNSLAEIKQNPRQLMVECPLRDDVGGNHDDDCCFGKLQKLSCWCWTIVELRKE